MTVCSTCTLDYAEAEFAACPLCAAVQPVDPTLDKLTEARKQYHETLAEPAPPAPEIPAVPAAEEATAPVRTPRGDGSESEIHDDQLAKLGEDAFVVGLLGFPEAGKTWFLNRLKDISEGYGMEPFPPKARNRSQVRGTRVVSAHHFLSKTPADAFAMVDIAGEQFENAITDNIFTQEKLLRVVKSCSAFIVLLPADEVLFAEIAAEQTEYKPQRPLAERVAEQTARAASNARLEDLLAKLGKLEEEAENAATTRRRNSAAKQADALADEIEEIRKAHDQLDLDLLAESHERLSSFIDGIGYLAGVVSLLDGKRTIEQMMRATDDDVAAHLASKDFKPSSKPIFVALSKADRLEAPSPMLKSMLAGDRYRMRLLNEFCNDPIETLQAFRPNIVQKLESWFLWSKVDFVTAFGDHGGGQRIDYRACYHLGVEAIIGWIHWAKDSRSWKRAAWVDLARARRFRRLRDFGLRARPRLGGKR